MAHWPKCILTGLHRIWHDIQSDSFSVNINSRQEYLICALIVLSAPVSRETSLLFPAGPATNIRLVIHQTTFDIWWTLHLKEKKVLLIYISLARQRGRETEGEELPWVGERESDWSQLPDLSHTIRAMQTITSQKTHPFQIHYRAPAVKLGPNPSPIKTTSSVHHPPSHLIPDLTQCHTNFRGKCVVFARNCIFANLIQYNMQYI